MMALTEKEKEINLVYLFTVWLRATGYNKIPTSAAIESLQRFMIKELNWKKKAAADKILWYFQKHQKVSENEIIDIWQLLQE